MSIQAQRSALLRLVILACLALAGCAPYPRDVSGTLDHIEESGRFRVGLVQIDPSDRPAALALVGRIAQATGARPAISMGPAEDQLARLEEGELDLVIGRFAEDSPWASSVAILEPLSSRTVGERRLGLAPAARNGENRWIALVEREIRDGAGAGA